MIQEKNKDGFIKSQPVEFGSRMLGDHISQHEKDDNDTTGSAPKQGKSPADITQEAVLPGNSTDTSPAQGRRKRWYVVFVLVSVGLPVFFALLLSAILVWIVAIIFALNYHDSWVLLDYCTHDGVPALAAFLLLGLGYLFRKPARNV